MGGPGLDNLKKLLVANNRYADWCTFGVFVGLLVEYTVLLFPKWKDLHRWEKLFTLIAAIAIAGGVWGEYHFGSAAADAAIEVENISEQKVAEAQLEASEAQRDAKASDLARVQLEAKLLKLRKTLEPRRLTGEQKEILRKVLESEPTPVAILSRMFDSEAADFAGDLASALNAAHWKSVEFPTWTESKYGVFVGALADTKAPQIELLSHALEKAGVHNRIITISGDEINDAAPHFQSHVLCLLVGKKPPLLKDAR